MTNPKIKVLFKANYLKNKKLLSSYKKIINYKNEKNGPEEVRTHN